MDKSVDREIGSLRASSPIWASEVSLARTRVLARLAQIGELALRLLERWIARLMNR